MEVNYSTELNWVLKILMSCRTLAEAITAKRLFQNLRNKWLAIAKTNTMLMSIMNKSYTDWRIKYEVRWNALTRLATI